MNKNLESNAIQIDILSQSYHEGIQKLIGDDEAIPDNFRLPSHIIEQRKKTWNDLFEKYSSNKSQVELNILTLQPESNMIEPQITQKRLPMRKPMSVVQHWVDTGNLPYAENCNNNAHSDTGSSLDEEYVESDPSILSPCPVVNSSLDKNSDNTKTLVNHSLRLASSSGSSVDTAAYILASHNTNKKVDSLAIAQNFKSNIRNLNIVHNYRLVNSVDNTCKYVKDTDADHIPDKRGIEKEKSFDKAFSFNKNKSNIRKSIENMNITENKIINGEQGEKQDTTTPCLVYYNDSDESIINSKFDNDLQIRNSQQNQNLNLIKRKKLYNYTESPVELTQASEDQLSLKSFRKKINNCKHPALETPKLSSSKQSYFTRCKQIRNRKKRNSRLLSFIKLNKSKMKKSFNSEYNEVKISDKNDNFNIHDSSWSSCDVQDNCNIDSNENSNNATVQHSFVKKDLNEKNYLQTDICKLKHLTISLHRLPYIYRESHQETCFETSSNQIFNQVKKNSEKVLKKNSAFLNDDKLFESVNKLFSNSSDNKKSFKSFIDVQFDKNIQSLMSDFTNNVPSELAKKKNNSVAVTNSINKLGSKLIIRKSTHEDISIKSGNEIPGNESYICDEEKENDKHLSIKAQKYDIVLSSSDESNEVSVKYNRITRFSKTNSNSEKSINDHLIIKQSSFETNSSDQCDNSVAINLKSKHFNNLDKNNHRNPIKQCPKLDDLETLNFNKKSFESTKISQNVCNSKISQISFKQKRKNLQSPSKEKIIRTVQTDIVQINDDMMSDVANKRIDKSEAKFCKRKRPRSRKSTIAFDETFDKDKNCISLSKNLQSIKAGSEDKKTRLDVSDSNSLTCFNDKLPSVENTKFRNLEDLHDKVVVFENSNFSKHQNILLDNAVNEISKSRSHKQGNKNHMKNKSSLIKEKYIRVSVSSDEECIVPLKMSHK